jgi:hypothetical protein
MITVEILKAPTGRTRCKFCQFLIKRGELRADMLEHNGMITSHAHLKCYKTNYTEVMARISEKLTLDSNRPGL